MQLDETEQPRVQADIWKSFQNFDSLRNDIGETEQAQIFRKTYR
jgi:hypothetical protein